MTLEGKTLKKLFTYISFPLLGSTGFWIPDIIVHATFGKCFNGKAVLGLTFLLPLLTIFFFFIICRKFKNYHPLTISVLMLFGIWLLGPLFIFIGASFSGGGFGSADIFGSWFVFLLWATVIFPMATFMMSTYDGALGALLIVTLAMTLIWIPKLRLSKGTHSNKQAIIAVTAVVVISLLSLLSIPATGRLSSMYMKDKIKDKAIDIKKWEDWVGKKMPDFTFDSIHEGLSPLRVEDLKGKSSILIFWATYDTPWSSNFEYARALDAQKDKLNINVYAVAVDELKDVVKKYLEKSNSLPVYHDPNSGYKHNLKIYGPVEQVLIIDANATLRSALGAPKNIQDIMSALDSINE